jgi:hypothetical protein
MEHEHRVPWPDENLEFCLVNFCHRIKFNKSNNYFKKTVLNFFCSQDTVVNFVQFTRHGREGYKGQKPSLFDSRDGWWYRSDTDSIRVTSKMSVGASLKFWASYVNDFVDSKHSSHRQCLMHEDQKSLGVTKMPSDATDKDVLRAEWIALLLTCDWKRSTGHKVAEIRSRITTREPGERRKQVTLFLPPSYR